jgi:endonuclease YncB( thermonuclease family)
VSAILSNVTRGAGYSDFFGKSTEIQAEDPPDPPRGVAGDTVMIILDVHPVRLIGVDTPRNRPTPQARRADRFGREAATSLRALVEGKADRTQARMASC